MAAGRWCVLPTSIALDLNLSLSEFRVMIVLSVHSKKSGWCKLKLASIAEESGLKTDTARKVVKRLEEAGYVEKVRHRTYCDYRVICDRHEDTGLEEDRHVGASQDRHVGASQDRHEDAAPYRTGSKEQVKENNNNNSFDDFWKEWITDDNRNDLCKSDEARIIWEADLSADEKADAIAGIPGYQKVYRLKTPDMKIKMLGAKRYLSEINHKDFCRKPIRPGISDVPEIDPACPYAEHRRRLAEDMQRHRGNYNSWMIAMRISEEDGKFRLYWPSKFLRDYCNQHFRASLDRVFGESHRCKVEPPPPDVSHETTPDL